MEDEILWSTRVTLLVRKLLSFSPEHSDEVQGLNSQSSFLDNLDELTKVEIDAAVIDFFSKDPVVVNTFAELDIDPEDNAHLADIFDPDNGGTITIRDFVDGLRRLRGKPKRSDIVTVDLMIRSIQLQVSDMCEAIPEILEAVRDNGYGGDPPSSGSDVFFC